MRTETLTRYHLVSGDTRMNVLLDRKLSIGTQVSLEDDGEFDDGKVWTIKERYETLERKSIKRGWNNNI